VHSHYVLLCAAATCTAVLTWYSRSFFAPSSCAAVAASCLLRTSSARQYKQQQGTSTGSTACEERV
jgi:hypothetical protein